MIVLQCYDNRYDLLYRKLYYLDYKCRKKEYDCDTGRSYIAYILNENLQGKHGGHLDQGTLTLQEQVLKNSCYENLKTIIYPIRIVIRYIKNNKCSLENIEEVNDKATNVPRILAVKSLNVVK